MRIAIIVDLKLIAEVSLVLGFGQSAQPRKAAERRSDSTRVILAY